MNNGGIPPNLRIDGQQRPDIDLRASTTLKITFTNPGKPVYERTYLQ